RGARRAVVTSRTAPEVTATASPTRPNRASYTYASTPPKAVLRYSAETRIVCRTIGSKTSGVSLGGTGSVPSSGGNGGSGSLTSSALPAVPARPGSHGSVSGGRFVGGTTSDQLIDPVAEPRQVLRV